MKKFKTVILILLLISNAFTFSGCWNYREVEDLGIVIGAAIDKENDKYTVTVESITSTIPNVSQAKTKIYSASGYTIFDAVRNIILKTGKKLFWSHNMVIILSPNVARSGVQKIIDWFLRDSEPRFTTWVMVSKTEKASDIFSLDTESSDVETSFDLNKIMENYNLSYQFPEIDIRKFVTSISSETASAVAPMANLVTQNGKTDIEVSGAAIFKKDKMVGEIDRDSTKKFLFISENVKDTLIPLKNVLNLNTDVTMEVFGEKRKFKVISSNNKIKINERISLTMSIDEISGQTDFTKEKKENELKKYIKNYITDELKATVKQVQEKYDSDIFGFGELIRVQEPKVWKKISNKYDSVFKTIQYEPNVEVHIKGSGTISKPMKAGE